MRFSSLLTTLVLSACFAQGIWAAGDATPPTNASVAFEATPDALAQRKLNPNARQAQPTALDAQKNPRVYEISKQLRCLVCQNENIADSNADLAIDLRKEVIAQVNAGKTDDEIIQFMVERYGDYVLYKPPFKFKTILLWCGPLLFVIVALAMIIRLQRQRRQSTQERSQSFDADQEDYYRRILRGEIQFIEGEWRDRQDSKEKV